MTDAKTDARRSFVRVLVPGVAAGALAAVACAHSWALPDANPTIPKGAPGLTSSGQVPLASALSLVVLAAWGALLVTRGRVRRSFAVLGLLGSLALLVVVILGHAKAPDAVHRTLELQFGLPDGAGASAPAHITGWYWVALVATVIVVACFALAVREVPRWPAMSGRYDAPAARRTPKTPTTQQEMWKAIDEGSDPTTGQGH